MWCELKTSLSTCKDTQGNRAHLGEVKGGCGECSLVEQWGSLTSHGRERAAQPSSEQEDGEEAPGNRKMGRQPLGGSIFLGWSREAKE